jgi:DNA-binding MarR family transcriptional regulator
MPQPQILDIAHVLREFATSVIRETPASSLSRTAAGTLSVLDRQGPQRVTTLAEREFVSQPAMTGLVQRLETTGLVSREPDPADARATIITITDAGVAALNERRHLHDEAIAARLATLSPADRDALAAASTAIINLTENHADR